MNELRRAIPFLLLPLLLLAAGCQLLPPGFLVPASPSPGPVAEVTFDPFVERTPDAVTLESLEAQVDAWEAEGIDSYQWQVRLACFCPVHEPVDVVVEDGAVVSAVRIDGTSIEPDDLANRFLTVDQLFAEMRAAIERGGTVEAAYGELGQPQVIGLDLIPRAVDDELTIETAGFAPTP